MIQKSGNMNRYARLTGIFLCLIFIKGLAFSQEIDPDVLYKIESHAGLEIYQLPASFQTWKLVATRTKPPKEEKQKASKNE